MNAHLVQLDICWEEKSANFARITTLLSACDIEAGDLVVLPEMFDTGFSLNVQATNDADEQTLGFLQQTAERFSVTLQGSRTVLNNAGRALNLATIVSPAGDVLCEYAKIHPFSYGKEPEKFDGGCEILTYDWCYEATSLTICPAICYDLRFAELFRMGLLAGAQMFVLGANWPKARQHHWRSLIIARAIENQAYFLGVNRTGADPHLAYTGGSICVDPLGEVIGELDNHEGVLSVSVDVDTLSGWRDTFPAWKDIRLLSIDETID